MQHYFGLRQEDDIIILSKEDEHHLINVMRGRLHEHLEIVIDGIVYLCRIERLQPLAIKIIEELSINRELLSSIVLLYCLPKGDKFELVLQKATELGVSEIYGVISKRVIIKVSRNDTLKKKERYQKIMNEASSQAHRNIRPIFKGFINIEDINIREYDHAYIAYEEKSLQSPTFLEEGMKIRNGEKIAVLVGPEGGFSPQEVTLANEKGFISISLGKRILRSETAAIYILSVISFLLERN